MGTGTSFLVVTNGKYDINKEATVNVNIPNYYQNFRKYR